MRLTKKRNGVNVIPMLNAVCGIDMPYWRIDRHDSLHSYLSGDAADKLAAYEDAEEQGLLVRLPCKVGDDVLRRLIDEINDMIENIEGDFPLLDFNSRYMMERGMRMSLMLIKALQKESVKSEEQRDTKKPRPR